MFFFPSLSLCSQPIDKVAIASNSPLSSCKSKPVNQKRPSPCHMAQKKKISHSYSTHMCFSCDNGVADISHKLIMGRGSSLLLLRRRSRRGGWRGPTEWKQYQLGILEWITDGVCVCVWWWRVDDDLTRSGVQSWFHFAFCISYSRPPMRGDEKRRRFFYRRVQGTYQPT